MIKVSNNLIVDIDVKSINQLLEWMTDNIEYGWMDIEGNKHYDFDGWYDKYIMLLPAEVKKYGIGTCYEQTIFAYQAFEELFPQFQKIMVFVQIFKVTTHTFLIFEDNDKLYHFEHSDTKNRGIHGPFSSVEEIIEKFLETYGETGEYSWSVMNPNNFKDNLTAPEFYELVGYDWERMEENPDTH